MRRTFALLAIVVGLIFAAGQSFGQLTLTGAGKNIVAGGNTVTVNATDPTATGTYQNNGASLNYTGLTVAAGTDTALVCALSRRDNANDVTAGVALTWDTSGGSPTNQAMTQLVAQSRFTTVDTSQLWGLRAPTPGNKTLHIAWTNASADNFVSCIAFDHVLQTNDGAAFPHTAANTAVASVTVTSATGNMVAGSYQGGSGVSPILGSSIFTNTVNGTIVDAGGDYISGATPTVGTTGSTLNIIVGADIAHD